jgi:hypothetical protein
MPDRGVCDVPDMFCGRIGVASDGRSIRSIRRSG